MKQSLVDITNETNDLHADYTDFLEELKAQGIQEIPPLMEFAIWRNEEFESRDEFTNPIPTVH